MLHAPAGNLLREEVPKSTTVACNVIIITAPATITNITALLSYKWQSNANEKALWRYLLTLLVG